jgi:RNA polymerase sigma-70 factor (ECF subfamily)
MTQPPDTRPSLILRLRNRDDEAAWGEFVAIYRPVIVRLALAKGLQLPDAEDLAQQVLLSVARNIGNWEHDPQRARFRTWLQRVVRNAILNTFSRMPVDRAPGGTWDINLLEQPVDDPATTELMELEWRREALRWAADMIRDEFQPASWAAFWLTAVHGLSAQEAARRTGKTAGAVYIAKSRIMRRLQEKVRETEGRGSHVR